MSLNRKTHQESTDDEEPIEVPLEQVLSAGPTDPYFAIHSDDGAWKWEFHDENNRVRAASKKSWTQLEAVMVDIRETQKRIGNLATPILRVV